LTIFAVALAFPAWAEPVQAQAAHTPGATTRSVHQGVAEFYGSGQHKRLWFGPTAGGAIAELVRMLGSADADGLTHQIDLSALLLAVRAASSGEPTTVKRAEILLSEAFVTYARELQQDPRVGVIYVDPELRPTRSAPLELLQAAAAAPSLEAYIAELGWMHPLYGKLRSFLVGQSSLSEFDRNRVKANLQRLRALPRTHSRYVLVNTANQRLYMYESGQLAGEMKVVVGGAKAQTPLMNAYIRHAVLNPYWNVPADLVARLAPNIMKRGSAYLSEKGYQVVADFNDAQAIDPATIDWTAVANGKKTVQMRQLPGPANAMGRVKFMFPNSQGIWLHDTPSRALFANDLRFNSNGCIRVEEPWRLGSWLFRSPLRPTRDTREKRLELPVPVPIFITYLTAVPRGSNIDYFEDGYRRDLPPLVQSTSVAGARPRR